MYKNNKTEPLFEWAFFINTDRNERFEEYNKNLERKYGILKKYWSFDKQTSLELLENYIKKQYCICEVSGNIYYYSKDRKPAINSSFGIGLTTPNEDAIHAFFPLNIKDNKNGMLFCFFRKKEEKEKYRQKWVFEKFISSSDLGDWRNILTNFRESLTGKYILGKLGADFDPTEIQIKEPGFDTGHVKENPCRFLPENVTEMFDFIKCKFGENHDYGNAINDLIETIIGYNIDSIDDKERLYSWPVEELSEFVNNDNKDGSELAPINFLYPFRFKKEIRAAMVIRVTIGQKSPMLTTILDLKQAYMGAKLYNPYFKSDWLTL